MRTTLRVGRRQHGKVKQGMGQGARDSKDDMAKLPPCPLTPNSWFPV
jgi:hypothetical protein